MYIKQLFMIILAYLLGHMISIGFHLPIPANVLGLLFLFGALVFRVIKLKDVENVADFIIAHLALIFLPSSVGIMEYFGVFKASFFKIMVPWLAAIGFGFFVAGHVTQWCIQAMEKREVKKKS